MAKEIGRSAPKTWSLYDGMLVRHTRCGTSAIIIRTYNSEDEGVWLLVPFDPNEHGMREFDCKDEITPEWEPFEVGEQITLEQEPHTNDTH